MAISAGYSPEGGFSFGISGSDGGPGRKSSYEIARAYQPGITQANAKAAITGAASGARAAGLHPLFALGGGAGGGSAPAFVGGQPRTPNQYAVSSKKVNPSEALINDANLGLINKRKDWLQEQIDASKAARTDTNGTRGATPIPLEFESARQVVPISTDKPGQMAGDHPSWKLHNLSFGGYNISVWAPTQETEELFQSQSMWPLVYAANQNEIHRWAREVFKDKSNIGKLSTMGKWLLQWAGSKI